MSPTATSLSFVSTSHFEGLRGGRLPSRRHAVLRQSSHIRIGYPIHHFRGRELFGSFNKRRLEPQITTGLLADEGSFPVRWRAGRGC